MSVNVQTTKFNELEYDVKIYLDNGTEQFQINPNSIVNLNIEDTLADWVIKGTMAIYYDFNIMETGASKTGVLGAVPSYTFRNDGNDILNINIFPRLDKAGLTIDNVHWKLVYKFSIYDMEDIDLPPGAQNAASTNSKCKKFYFWDEWYQKMITNTMEYSTANNNEKTAGARRTSIPDFLRSKFTGVAMKEVIEKALSEQGISTTNIVGGGKGDDWEDGSTNVFYTAPATNNAYDTLMDIYDRHVSANSNENLAYDYSILYKERGPNDNDVGYFALRPFSKFFEKAGKTQDAPGDYQIEHFFVQDYSNNKTVSTKRAPYLNTQNMQKDTKLANYSMITSYRFVDISAFTNASKFRTHAVNSYDFLNRTFNIEFQQNSVLTARDLIVDKYISEVFKSTENAKSLFLLTLERSKRGKNIIPIFSLYSGTHSLYGNNVEEDLRARQSDGLHNLLRTGVFQNACLHFRCLGSTNRECGRFIAIDKTEGIEENKFNDKFYGQWFVINVQHIFEAGMYYNEITAIKVHRFKGTGVTFNNLISETPSPANSPAVTSDFGGGIFNGGGSTSGGGTSGGGGGGGGTSGGGGGGETFDENLPPLDPLPDDDTTNNGGQTPVEPDLPQGDSEPVDVPTPSTGDDFPVLEPLPDQ